MDDGSERRESSRCNLVRLGGVSTLVHKIMEASQDIHVSNERCTVLGLLLASNPYLSL